MSKRALHFLFAVALLTTLFLVTGCQTMPAGIQQQRVSAAQTISSEQPGDYFIGRRYFKASVFKFWGYVRKPGQPWKTAQLVVFNEKEKLAPDREIRSFGSDNNCEYKLWGRFSGETVYEPASNGFYQEFILERYELVSQNPPPIFRSQYNDRARAAVGRMQIEKPE
ncbi:MAG TPA: hypothetical protein VM940_00605 [Chthoniobacterales bacterium]|nr:hypothetical protein [Chthoniobacterales bacterium]